MSEITGTLLNYFSTFLFVFFATKQPKTRVCNDYCCHDYCYFSFLCKSNLVLLGTHSSLPRLSSTLVFAAIAGKVSLQYDSLTCVVQTYTNTRKKKYYRDADSHSCRRSGLCVVIIIYEMMRWTFVYFLTRLLPIMRLQIFGSILDSEWRLAYFGLIAKSIFYAVAYLILGTRRSQ